MTKRASGKFKRRAQDAYDTPVDAVCPLLPHLPERNVPFSFWEPCAGAFCLTNHIRAHFSYVDWYCSDISPRHPNVILLDALKGPFVSASVIDFIITNPPWTRKILHPMIEHFAGQAPTWLLFDAGWMHTKQAIPYLKYCAKIVSVGRVSWMGNGVSGFDNCAWYLFDKRHTGATEFVGRI